MSRNLRYLICHMSRSFALPSPYLLLAKYRGIMIALLLSSGCIASDTLTLWQCITEATLHYPLLKDKEYYLTSGELKLRNLNAVWLPRIEVNGVASWQSDVIEFDLHFPYGNIQMPQVPHENIKATMDINQTLYDGGANRYIRKIEQTNIQTEVQQVTVDLEKVKEQVIRIFYGLLVLQQNERILLTVKDDLEKKLSCAAAGVRNGVLPEADRDALEIELLKTKQQLTEAQNDRNSFLQILTLLTGLPIKDTIECKVPVIYFSESAAITRPEYQLFALQNDRLQHTMKLKNTQRIPRLFSYAQVGYGKPGLNYMNDEFDSFLIIGAGLKWTLWDWNSTNREKQLITIQQEMIKNKKEAFDKQLEIQLETAAAMIRKYESSVNTWQKIVRLRESITQSASARFDNGTITSAEYLTEMNHETQARLNLETCKILLLQAQTDYMQLKGQLVPAE